MRSQRLRGVRTDGRKPRQAGVGCLGRGGDPRRAAWQVELAQHDLVRAEEKLRRCLVARGLRARVLVGNGSADQRTEENEPESPANTVEHRARLWVCRLIQTKEGSIRRLTIAALSSKDQHLTQDGHSPRPLSAVNRPEIRGSSGNTGVLQDVRQSGTTKHLISFATRNQMQTAAGLINNQTDKIIIAIFIGPAAAGAYELANRVAAAARSVGMYTMSAMVPTLTVELRQAPRESWGKLYERLTAVTTALAVPALLLAAALAPILFGAWLGYTPKNSVLVLAALSVAYIAIATTGVGFSFAYAGGFPGLPAIAAAVTAVANIVLTAGLAPVFGIWGVLAGTALAFTLGALSCRCWLVHRRLAMPLVHYWRAALPSLGPAVALAVPVLICSLIAGSTARVL